MLAWQLLLPAPAVSTRLSSKDPHARGILYLPTAKCLIVLLLALMWAAATPFAWAGPGFQPVSPDELKLTSEPQAPGAAAILLYRQVDRDDNGHTSHEDTYLRIKILTEAGR